jgi:hypothetical protein
VLRASQGSSPAYRYPTSIVAKCGNGVQSDAGIASALHIVLADLRDGLVELGLAATGDVDIGALFNEPLGGREANAAAAPVITAILFVQ